MIVSLSRQSLSLMSGLAPSSSATAVYDARILVLGLDGSGKTSLLQRFLGTKPSADNQVVPTIGFNVELVRYWSVTMQMWDCGGQDSIRSLWRHYFSGCQGLIYVIDATDPGRLNEAQRELTKIADSLELEKVPIAILANKMDEIGSNKNMLTVEQIKEGLGCDGLRQEWKIFCVSAKHGTGMKPVLQWMAKKHTPKA
jgi:small GTP-binding protein